MKSYEKDGENCRGVIYEKEQEIVIIHGGMFSGPLPVRMLRQLRAEQKAGKGRLALHGDQCNLPSL